ncbi:HIT family protein [Salisediminibacterium selenitireducens]|uniref:Histidine triad (HIT) protein n=1 Tax=Bacillus selenitireducens (strain ATCC 700615 / DSM 15326 / MLS10) TaxID=439292 RepID=D6XX10_BACIE|nr:HIT family protein [Salisediminibacterium selenitireducens]ADH99986.1 histidine triad (HIT) protein [[Bacillus] selenitireducens MLS10]
MSHNENCIFCKIIQGDIPGAKVYEDDHVLAFLDISQVTKGHTLVIPKQHEESIFELSEETARNLFAAVPKVSGALKAAFDPKGLNILNNNGEFAGQSVFHYHLHLLPRYSSEDGFDAKWVTHTDDYTGEDLAKLATAIQENLS